MQSVLHRIYGQRSTDSVILLFSITYLHVLYFKGEYTFEPVRPLPISELKCQKTLSRLSFATNQLKQALSLWASKFPATRQRTHLYRETGLQPREVKKYSNVTQQVSIR